jgi:hypothetical protein
MIYDTNGTTNYARRFVFRRKERIGKARKKKELLRRLKCCRMEVNIILMKKVRFRTNFLKKQINQREKEVIEQKINEFYETPNQAFKLGVEIGLEEKQILEEMIRENRKYIQDIKKEGEEWLLIPTQDAVKEVALRMPPKFVPFGQLLNYNERSEYPPLMVNYTLTLEQAIAEGNFGEVNEGIKKFSLDDTGEREIIPELVRFGRNLDWEEAEKEIEKLGLRSSTLRELLAFAAANPNDLNWESPIYAIGMKAIIKLDEEYTPFVRLTSRNESRNPMYKQLGVHWVLNKFEDFHNYYLVLGIKK